MMRPISAFSALIMAACMAGLSTAPASAQDAEELLEVYCGACHLREDGSLTRIDAQRKTPEGWLMTIVRMGIMHGVETPPDARRALVKHLSDTRGLAPEEAEPYRYALERVPNVIEEFPFDEEFIYMCGRCHTGARAGLQRRTTEDWRLHVHFHLGQWPTTEYQFFSRDREWFRIATTETAEVLGREFPLETPEWTAWQDFESPDLSGNWRFVAQGPGVGSVHGMAEFRASGGDQYEMRTTSVAPDGSESTSIGNAILYTGYEFRARTSGPQGESLLIGTVSSDGNVSTGRSMLAEADEVGFRYRAVRVRPGHAEVLAVMPPYLRAGTTATLQIHGTGLSGDVSLGDGVRVVEVVAADENTVTVVAEAAADAGTGMRPIAVGGAGTEAALAVYDRIDEIRVEPDYGIARVGGAGGPIDPVLGLFEAVAWAGDMRIGVMPATWSVEPFDEIAEELGDVQFAGSIDPATGIYMPADAGLNPARPFSTNNAGNLRVVATVTDAGQELQGEGQLIVTVQRWNDPPIR